MKDQSFDGIANKFAKNIYGTTKGRLRHTLLCEQLSKYLPTDRKIKTIDIGGGTGVMARFLAEQGHDVILCDASNDVLDIAKQSLSELPSIDIRHLSLQELSDLSNIDLIVCHAVLEWLNDPFHALTSLCAKMKTGALLSLSFFNKDALLFGNALYGNFEYIENDLKVKKQVRLNPSNPLAPKDVLNYCKQLDLEILEVTGIRCFHDYLKQNEHMSSKYDQLLQLERQYCQTEPFMWMGKYMHVMLRKV